MRKSRLALILALLIYGFYSATNSPANDRLQSLDTLFTANVHVTDFTLYPNQDEMRSDSGVRFDNEARVLLIDNLGYPFPEQVRHVWQVFPSEEDDILLLEVSESLPDTDVARNRSRFWVWTFDVQTEQFLSITPLCGNPSQLRLSDLLARWVYVTDPDTNVVRLCEPAIGAESQPLPIGLSWVVSPPFTTAPLPVITSPDAHWLLLFGEADEHIEVYSYNTETAHLTYLGLIPCLYCIEPHWVRWFGTTVTIGSWHFPDEQMIYGADIADRDSLTLAISRPYYEPEFYDNPPRFDYVNFTTPESIWDTQCQHVVYDILSSQIQVTDMGFLCRPEWGTLDGVGYYRDVSQGAAGRAALTRFDARTLESEVLYVGEIEWIEWISPDERYAIVVLDTDGYINTPPFRAPLFSWSRPTSPTLAYIDLTNDQVIFESRTGWLLCTASLGGPNLYWSAGLSTSAVEPCYSVGPTGAIFLRDDNTFLAIGDIEPENDFYSSLQFADIVTITDMGIVRTRVLEGWLIPFTADYVLRREWDERNRTYRFSLESVNEQASIAITHPISVEDYPSISVTDIYAMSHEIRFYFQSESHSQRDWVSAYVTVQIEIP